MQTVKLVPHPLSISYQPPLSLKADSKNPRIHSDKQVRQIAQSIKAFGFNVPILVDRELKVIAGHGRVAAARLLQMEIVPIKLFDWNISANISAAPS